MNDKKIDWRLTGVALAAALLAGCGGGDDNRASADGDRAAQLCAELAGGAGLRATKLETSYVPAGTKRPGNAAEGEFLGGHCVVTGAIDPRTGVDGKAYAIGFQLALPDRWNGRFLYMGGGGNDGGFGDTSGSLRPGNPSPLAQGFAVVTTDAGHKGGVAAEFGFDPQARIDHAYNAHDKTAQAAKSLITTRYGKPADKSYFQGCSGGGRQGMMFSQRFPGYFDGIVAIAPAMRVSSGATVAAMWNNIEFTRVAPRDGDGRSILARAFSDGDLTLVANAVVQACDARDGAADGMVNDFRNCSFDPKVLQCTGAKADSCLSADQVGALQKVFRGPFDSTGTRLYAGQPWDPGLAAPGWRAWTLGFAPTATPTSAYNTLMADALKFEFFTPPDPDFDILKFDFDRDPARMEAFSAVYDTYRDATLGAFRDRGGKLLLVHGMADPIFSALDTQDYYERLTANNGGQERTQQFARAFFVPGMNHCAGGPATDAFDPLQATVDWVEKGKAPEVIAAAALPNNPAFPNRTRPLCAYPKFAKYKGSGSLEDAASFTCATN